MKMREKEAVKGKADACSWNWEHIIIISVYVKSYISGCSLTEGSILGFFFHPVIDFLLCFFKY